MRPDAGAADRHAEVRAAGRTWRRSSLVDDAALAALEKLHADDRIRLGLALRSLVFVFTLLAIVAATVFWFMVMDLTPGSERPTFVVIGGLLALATEVATRRFRLAATGVETACALGAAFFVTLGFSLLLEHASFDVGDSTMILVSCAFATAACLAGAWRWGTWSLAMFGTMAFYGVLAQLPAPRMLFVLAALVLAWPLQRGMGDVRLPPAHRTACAGALVVALAALYAAVHLWSWDEGLIERLADLSRFRDTAAVPMRGLAILGTALVPPVVLAWGIVVRRRLIVDVGILMAAASVATLRLYVHVAPAWVILTAAGTVAVLLALALRRWLDAGRDRERRGFTADDVLAASGRERVLEMAAAVVTLGPAPSDGQGPAEPGFKGEGGRSGGGGASGDY